MAKYPEEIVRNCGFFCRSKNGPFSEQEIIPNKYLKRRNQHTLVILMNSENDRFTLAKYIYHALLKRSNLIPNV